MLDTYNLCFVINQEVSTCLLIGGSGRVFQLQFCIRKNLVLGIVPNLPPSQGSVFPIRFASRYWLYNFRYQQVLSNAHS